MPDSAFFNLFLHYILHIFQVVEIIGNPGGGEGKTKCLPPQYFHGGDCMPPPPPRHPRIDASDIIRAKPLNFRASNGKNIRTRDFSPPPPPRTKLVPYAYIRLYGLNHEMSELHLPQASKIVRKCHFIFKLIITQSPRNGLY